MGCGCNKGKSAEVLPSLQLPDGTIRQFDSRADAVAAQAEVGGAIVWLPKLSNS